jgi:hypothetical protein
MTADALFDVPAAGGVLAGAQISTCGTYRYTLDRVWDSSLPTAVFIMLNPSVADASIDDPTIRRCIGFAKREGYGGLTVLNLYALRATNPSELRSHVAPIGARNSMWTCAVLCRDPGLVIVAWGADPAACDQVSLATHAIAAHGLTPMCLGTTKTGAPRHPLYVRADQPLQAWTPANR